MNASEHDRAPNPEPARETSLGARRETDFLILGSGIAGASLALKLAPLGRVLVVTKDARGESNSRYAQGGIACVWAEDDTTEEHIQDTLRAGDGLCHEDVVRNVVEAGPGALRELLSWGVEFSSEPGPAARGYHLTREGGHSRRRILHAEDHTGLAVQTALLNRVAACPNIEVWEQATCLDLIVTDKVAPDFAENRCLGAYVLAENRIHTVLAGATVLATGGHGKVYLYTSNPDIATGDGVAMAWRAGARIANLEFVQFHPTCLHHPQAKNLLISESLRGEGALLFTRSGRRLMEGIDPRLELASRDIVSRGIDAELRRSGESHVYLDLSHKPQDWIRAHFPSTLKQCLGFGIDITQEPIPVVPAAHYCSGGVVTDAWGRTSVRGLWALGEVACTGFHGANRLASNSLLEGLTFAGFAAQRMARDRLEAPSPPPPPVPDWRLGRASPPEDLAVIGHMWDEIRRLMWNYVGILRTERRLAQAHTRLSAIREEIGSAYWDATPRRDIVEVRNLCTVANLTVRCARLRKETRGGHASADYPERDDSYFAKDTVIS